ncbi:MAG: phosphotransferase [Candidatus Thorarchaeota archaeon]
MSGPRPVISHVKIDRIEKMMSEKLGCDNSSVHVSPDPLGGWSNINLLLVVDGRRMVLKMPCLRMHYSTNPFELQYRSYRTLSDEGIAPRPVSFGRLDDEYKTPFILLDFAEGMILDDLRLFGTVRLNQLSSLLNHLNSTHVPGLPAFRSPAMYLEALLSRLEPEVIISDGVSPDTTDLLHGLSELVGPLRSYLESMNEWDMMTIHGDLQESNIVFTTSGPMMLDLESLMVADPSLDLAYLFVQRDGDMIRRYPPELVHDESTASRVNSLIPLALVSAVAWTIERLSWLDRGLLDDCIAKVMNRDRMVNYVRSKLLILQSH